MIILGIDPGMSGGICLLFEDSVILEPMPVQDGCLDLDDISHILYPFADQVTRAYLELQSIRPMQSGQFKIGRGFGQLEAVLWALKIQTEIVKPEEWSKHFPHGVEERDIKKRQPLIKKARAEIAARLYPGLDIRRNQQCRTPDDGLVDALLIARFGWNRMKGIKR